MFYRDEKAAATDRIDRWMTHPVWGVPIFLCIMACVFFLTFTVGDLLKGGFEAALAVLSHAVAGFLTSVGAAGWLNSLIVDGILARCGRDPDLFAEYFYPFPGAGVSGGQRLYGQSGLCHGRHHGKSGAVGKGISAHGAGLWLYRAGHYGNPGAGDGEGQAENHAGDTVYVLLGQTADLCLIFGYLF